MVPASAGYPFSNILCGLDLNCSVSLLWCCWPKSKLKVLLPHEVPKLSLFENGKGKKGIMHKKIYLNQAINQRSSEKRINSISI